MMRKQALVVLLALGACAAPHPTPVAHRPPVRTPANPLTIVAGGETVVAPGETLFAVSRRTGADVTDLISANTLTPPYALRAGQALIVPQVRYHRVGPGDTTMRIARRYDITVLDIVRLNNLSSASAIAVGRKLKLPSEDTMPVVPLKFSTPETERPISTRSPTPPPATRRPATTATSTAEGAPAFIWPVVGRVVMSFGDQGNGRYNDGINLAVPRGTAVKAAADGVVLFADTMRGFGRLLLVRHPGNWLTAYAHNDRLLVARGATVRRGEVIAQAGKTGSVPIPQLHFELRRGARPLDPLLYLPKPS